MVATLLAVNVQLRNIQPGGSPSITVKWALSTDTDSEMKREGSFGMPMPAPTTTLAQLRTLVRNELAARGII